jgi:hypothetical protein
MGRADARREREDGMTDIFTSTLVPASPPACVRLSESHPKRLIWLGSAGQYVAEWEDVDTDRFQCCCGRTSRPDDPASGWECGCGLGWKVEDGEVRRR